jgi:hypothetical protein
MSRTGEFSIGSGSKAGEPASLMRTQAQQNSQDPGTFKANGLNQPIMHSPMNGNGPQDASRQTLNGQLPDSNGMALDTYKQLTPSIGTNLNI